MKSISIAIVDNQIHLMRLDHNTSKPIQEVFYAGTIRLAHLCMNTWKKDHAIERVNDFTAPRKSWTHITDIHTRGPGEARFFFATGNAESWSLVRFSTFPPVIYESSARPGSPLYRRHHRLVKKYFGYETKN